MLRSVALTAGLVTMLGGPLYGQAQLVVSPYAGGYLPVRDIFDQVVLGGRNVVNMNHNSGLIFGLRAGVRFSRLGFEGEIGYSPGSVDVPDIALSQGVPDGAHAFLASAQVLYTIVQAPFSPLAVYVVGGGGVVSKGGEFYDGFDDVTDIAAVTGLGLRFGIGPISNVRFDVRTYIYEFKPSRGGVQQTDSNTQFDVTFTLGFDLNFPPLP